MTVELNHAAGVLRELDEIQKDLATRQPELEQAATRWFDVKRDFELAHARAFLDTSGTVDERKAQTLVAVSRLPVWQDYKVAEGRYEGAKAVQRTLDARASVLQSILRSHREGM